MQTLVALLSSRADGTLTITVKDDITNKIEQAVSHDSLIHYEVDASDENTIFNMLDYTMWGRVPRQAAGSDQEGVTRGAVLTHHGTTFNTTFRNDSPYGDSKMNPADNSM